LLVVLAPGCFASPAHVGSAFADAYSAFAPLHALHAEYLFQGAVVVLPPGLALACQSCPETLEILQGTLIVQTDSPYIEEVGYVVRLRRKLDSLCSNFQEQLIAITTAEEPDLFPLAQLADDGLFEAIKESNTIFRELLIGIPEKLETGERWVFNAAFATRTLMNQETIKRIDAALEPILLGSEEASPPPANLPEEITHALQSLAALSDRDLSSREQLEADTLARSIHAFLIQGD